jgi:hypothetical protein
MIKIRHALMGWVFEEVGKRVVKRKIAQKRQELLESKVKIGAASAIALVLIGGVVAAKAGSSDD